VFKDFIGYSLTSLAIGDLKEGSVSRKVLQAFPSKNAIPQPSSWSAVFPPLSQKPSKEKQISVGTLQFIPSSWHIGSPMFIPSYYINESSDLKSNKIEFKTEIIVYFNLADFSTEVYLIVFV